jgi:hypothetical protein
MQSLPGLTAPHIAPCSPAEQEGGILPQQSYTDNSRTLQCTRQGRDGPACEIPHEASL